jgi:hypothetical protein
LAQTNPSTCYNYLHMYDFQGRFYVRKMSKCAFQNDLKCENPFNDITTLKFILQYMGSWILVIDQNELVGPKKTSWHNETTIY